MLEKQFQFVAKVKQVMVEDLRVILEREFRDPEGGVPDSIETVVAKGEKSKSSSYCGQIELDSRD